MARFKLKRSGFFFLVFSSLLSFSPLQQAFSDSPENSALNFLEKAEQAASEIKQDPIQNTGDDNTLEVEAELPRSIIIPNASNLNISTPSFKNRKTLKIRLENGLEAYLVSDPNLKESGALVGVEIGSWDNPDNALGMAHFVEHMLFISSEKYSEPDGFFHFIGANGGQSNAFTSTKKTCYYFTVKNEAFDEAFDRFSQFFISPQFNPDFLEREKNAVNSEYRRQFNHDGWRMQELEQFLCSQDHPRSRFSTGDLESLGPVSREQVVNWYQSNYSANLMQLVVYSPKSLSALKKQVEKTLSIVPARDVNASDPKGTMATQDRKASIVYMAPKQAHKKLELSWELPRESSQDNTYHSNRLIASILESEAEGSLLHALKEKGFAETISAGKHNFSRNQAIFEISIRLTDAGAKQHMEVIEKTFQALSAIRSEKDLSSIFENVQTSERLGYEYQMEKPPFNALFQECINLFTEDLATYPQKTCVTTAFSQEKTHEFLSYLTATECSILVSAPTSLTNKELDQKQTWLSVEYTTETIDPKVRMQWQTARPLENFKLSRKNPFLPNSLDKVVIPENAGQKALPTKLEDSDEARLFHVQDRFFHIPKIALKLRLRSPKMQPTSVKQKAALLLAIDALKQKMSPIRCESGEADISSNIYLDEVGLVVETSGWKSGTISVMERSVVALKNLKLSDVTFAQSKERILTILKSAQKASPIRQAFNLSQKTLVEKEFLPAELERSVRALQVNDIERLQKEWLSQVHLEFVASGHLSKEEVVQLKENFYLKLGAKAFPISQHSSQKAVKLSNKIGPFIVCEKVSVDGNAAILNLQEDSGTLKGEMSQELITKALGPYFFEELRTHQQTGYVAHATTYRYAQKLATVLYVESTTHTPEELLARFDLFLESFMQNFDEKFPRDKFESVRSAMISDYKKPPLSLSYEVNLQFKLAFDYAGNFDLLDQKVSVLEQIQYEEIKTFAASYLSRNNRQRLAVFVYGNAPGVLSYQHAKSPQSVQRHGEFLAPNQAVIHRMD